MYDSVGGSYESAKRVMQMDRLIGKFIMKFLDDKSYSRLIAGRESGDHQELFEGAHALKGVCANLGFDSLSAKVSDIAEEFRPGHTPVMSPEELDSRFAEITEMYNRTIAGIREYAAQ